MFSSPRLAQLALLALPCLPATTLAADGASGHFGNEDQRLEIADAIAYRDGMFLMVVVSDQSFDLADFAADGRLDSMDFLRHQGATFELRLEPEEGDLWGYTLRPGAGKLGTVSGSSSDLANAFRITHIDAERVRGELDDGERNQLRFDLPIQGTEIARPGQPLPADGGEPGRVLREMIAATHAGDIDRMIALASDEQAASFREAERDGETAMVLEMAKMFMPQEQGLEVTGGTEHGNTAWVDFSGRDHTGNIRGTATLQRTDGRWHLENIDTRSGEN